MLFLTLSAPLAAAPAATVEVAKREADRRVDVSIDGKPPFDEARVEELYRGFAKP